MRKAAAAPNTESHAEVASIKSVAPDEKAKLLAEIADLKAKLGVSEEARSEQEKRALELAEQQAGVMQIAVQEVPTGKKVKVQRCKEYETVGYKDDGRPILKPVFHTVELPTFFYKIDLPPVGGDGLKVNGLLLAHGAVMEFDLDTLRSVKDQVAKVWEHERNIHGTDENVFRKPTNVTLRGGARA